VSGVLSRQLGFQVGFEASWFVYLHSTGDRPRAVAFMAADHPSQPPGPETFSGKGLFLTLQVSDAIEPQPGFWEPYTH
jgi:hypothetical protein